MTNNFNLFDNSSVFYISLFDVNYIRIISRKSKCDACPESKDTKVLNTYKIFNLQKRCCEGIAST